MRAGGDGVGPSVPGRMLGRLRAATGLALLGLALAATPAGAEEAAITLPGSPLTVSIGPLGQCQSSYSGHGNNYGGSATIGECGFFLAFPSVARDSPTTSKGTTFGGVAGHPGLSLYQEDVRSLIVGSGTAADPYLTDHELRSSWTPSKIEDAVVIETTTYVNGASQFTSTYSVKNVSGGNLYFRAIYAGHLLAAGTDKEVGAFLSGPPRFVGAQNAAAGVLGGFQEAPSAPWSHFGELSLTKLWTTLESSANPGQTFNDTVETAETESGAGVEWDQRLTTPLPGVAVVKGEDEQEFTIVNRTQIQSGLQVTPGHALKLGQTETPDSSYRVQSIHANSNGTVTISFVPTQAGRAVLAVTVPTATIARRQAVAAKQAKKCRKGQIKIGGKCRPRTTVTGQVSGRGTAGVALKLAVNPSTKIKALLKKGNTVHLTATLTYSSSLGGRPTVKVFHVTVKGKKPTPHKH